MLHRVLGAAGREAYDVLRARTPTHRRLRDRLVVVATVSVVLDLVCAALAYWIEHGAAQTEIKTFGSALFWTSTQLLTVSSSLKNPITPAGRVLDVLMELYAITVVATLAGSFSAFLHKRGRERDEAGAAPGSA